MDNHKKYKHILCRWRYQQSGRLARSTLEPLWGNWKVQWKHKRPKALCIPCILPHGSLPTPNIGVTRMHVWTNRLVRNRLPKSHRKNYPIFVMSTIQWGLPCPESIEVSYKPIPPSHCPWQLRPWLPRRSSHALWPRALLAPLCDPTYISGATRVVHHWKANKHFIWWWPINILQYGRMMQRYLTDDDDMRFLP